MITRRILRTLPIAALMSTLLYVNFLTMCAAVVMNLVVGRFDRTGRAELGDRVDRRCRWVFPGAYFGLLLLVGGYFFLRY